MVLLRFDAVGGLLYGGIALSAVETVILLFTDLVGSTGLVSRIGPAAAEELGREHFDLLRSTIEETGGREVKNLGDGLMVVFPSASSAVACAVAMQQRIELRNRRAEEQLGVRIGLSMGDAALEDGDYFGTPVIEAARLCAKAAGGQILVKELVRHMAGGRDGHRFVPVGDIEVKGLPEPVSAVEVAWEPLEGVEAGIVPIPPRLQEVPPIGYVGRAAERERLTRLRSSAGSGRRRLVLLSGEPGIGKTRLATHAALEAHAEGAAVLYGRCEEDLGVPYAPWVEALRHYVEHAAPEILHEHVERYGGELTRIASALGRRVEDVPPPRDTDPDTERYLLWGAVAGLLGEASRDVPIVLVLDDLHWADRPTLALLKHVIGHSAGTHVLVIATYRDSDVGRDDPLTNVLADLRREQGVDRITLTGLDQPDVVTLMEAAAGHELDEKGLALAHEILRETDGNPFYVAELLRHLTESGALYQADDGRWTLRGELGELGLPQSVREVVGRRVERLGGEAVKALSIASVVGRDFDVELLLWVTERSEDELLDLLDEAVEAAVLMESTEAPGRFSFAHALISHTLYDGLGTTRRARLHRRVAEALEDICGDDPGPRLAELAHHWSEATTPVDGGKAVEYARRAGERALAELAPDEALRLFTHALELHGQQVEPDRSERCDLLIGLGEAQRQVGEAAFRETLLEAGQLASELGDADRATTAALANSRGLTSQFGEVDEERLAALVRAVELDESENPARCARLLSRQSMELQFDFDPQRRRELAERALALARTSGDPRTLAWVLHDHFYALWAPDTLEVRRANAREQVEMAELAGDPAARLLGMADELAVTVEAGDLAGGVATAERLRELADELGQPTFRWLARYQQACLAILRGDLAEAERLSEEAVQVGGETGQGDAFMVYGAQIGVIRSFQDRNEEIVAIVEQSVAANPRIPAWHAGLASLYCWLGRTDEAALLVEEAAEDGFARVPHDQVRLTALTLYADAAAQTGSESAAAKLYELIEPWADQVTWNSTTTYGHVRTYLAMLAATLGWHDLADEHFAHTCEFQERSGMVMHASRARMAWAEALARRGERQRAREEADRALDLARRGGYPIVERRAAAVAERAVSAP